MANLLDKIRDTEPVKAEAKEARGKSPSRASHTYSPTKVYSLIASTTLLAAFASYFISRGSLGWGITLLVLFSAVFIVQSLLLRHTHKAFLAGFLNSLGLLIFFAGEELSYLLMTLLFVVVFFVWANVRGAKEIENTVKIRFSRVVRPVVSLLLTGLTVFAGFLFFINGDTLLREENVGRTVDVLVAPAVRFFVEDFSSDMTMGDLARGIAKRNLSGNEEFRGLPEAGQELLIRRGAEASMQSMESLVETEIDPRSSFKGALTDFISRKSQDLSEENRPARALVLVLVLVLIIKSVEIVLYLPLTLLAFMVYELMIAFNFVALQFESRSKEVANLI